LKKYIIFLGFLFCFSGFAFSQSGNWVKYHSNPVADYFYDSDNIIVKGDKLFVW